MKALLTLLFVLCATACSDHGNFARVKMSGGPEFRFSGSPYTVTIKGSTLEATHIGRTILYENGALYVDGRLLELPPRARVITFEGSVVDVDGRSIAN